MRAAVTRVEIARRHDDFAQMRPRWSESCAMITMTKTPATQQRDNDGGNERRSFAERERIVQSRLSRLELDYRRLIQRIFLDAT